MSWTSFRLSRNGKIDLLVNRGTAIIKHKNVLFIAGVEIADGENDRYMPEEEEGLKFRNDRNTDSTGKKEVNMFYRQRFLILQEKVKL